MIEKDRLNLDAETLEDHRPGDAWTRSLDMESHLLARQILQVVDARARQDVKFGVVHLRYVIDPLVDIPRLARFLVKVENVGVRNRDVEAPQVEKIRDIFGRSIGDDRQDAEIVAVIESLAEFGRKADETALKLAGGDGNGPTVDESDLRLFAADRGCRRAAGLGIGWLHSDDQDGKQGDE